MLLALALAACFAWRLARTQVFALHDVHLVFALAAPPRGADAGPEGLGRLVLARLRAAEVTAEVVADPKVARIDVRVDAHQQKTVRSTLRWRGGVALYGLDPTYRVAPRDTTGLREEVLEVPGGVRVPVWVGAPEVVGRAVDDIAVDDAHVALFERIDERRARLRFAALPEVLDLADGIDHTEPADEGRSARIVWTHAARALLAHLPPDQIVLVVRDRTIVAQDRVANLRGDDYLVRFGTDVAAYTRAQRARSLLATRTLPKLRMTEEAPVAPDVLLAVVTVALPVLLSLVWLGFVRTFGRAHTEPWSIMLATYCLGGLATLLCDLVPSSSLTPLLDPRLMSFGHRLSAFPVDLVVFTLVVGVVEEGAKLLAVLGLCGLGAVGALGPQRAIDAPVDGIVCACAAALGFAAIENVAYFSHARLDAAIVTSRSLECVHLFLSAPWGYALGRHLRRVPARGVRVSAWRVVPLFLLSAFLHGLWDTCCEIDATTGVVPFLFLALLVLYAALLRDALRDGGVTTRAAGADQRRVFHVGSRPAFLAWLAVTLGLGAYAVQVGTHVHAGAAAILPITASAVVLVALGACAMQLARTLPLDAVVDDGSITVAGCSRPLATIEGLARRPAFGAFAASGTIEIRSSEGDLHVGPAAPSTLDDLEATLRGRTLLEHASST